MHPFPGAGHIYVYTKCCFKDRKSVCGYTHHVSKKKTMFIAYIMVVSQISQTYTHSRMQISKSQCEIRAPRKIISCSYQCCDQVELVQKEEESEYS